MAISKATIIAMSTLVVIACCHKIGRGQTSPPMATDMDCGLRCVKRVLQIFGKEESLIDLVEDCDTGSNHRDCGCINSCMEGQVIGVFICAIGTIGYSILNAEFQNCIDAHSVEVRAERRGIPAAKTITVVI